MSDGEGRVTTYRYGEQQHLIALITPDGAETHYQRDIHGNLLSVTDPLGRMTRHSYVCVRPPHLPLDLTLC